MALRHELSAAHVEADHLTELNALTVAIGAVTINGFLLSCRRGSEQSKKKDVSHAEKVLL